MFKEIPEMEPTRTIVEKQAMARKLEVAAWGLFFVWIGAAAIMHISWGMGLLGVGVITLGMQIVRKRFGLVPEGFWVVIGGLFLLGGLWELFSVGISLLPVVFLGIGGVLLWSVTARRHHMRERHL